MNFILAPIRFFIKLLLVLASTLAVALLVYHHIPGKTLDQILAQAPNPDADIVVPTGAIFKNISLSTGVVLTAIEGGNTAPDAELMLFLHGFPETALLTWHNQIEYFSKSKYHLLAIDMRGFNTSSKPEGVSQYSLDYLTADVKAVITEYAKKEKVVLISHDWGAIVAWNFAVRYPSLLSKLVTVDAPHSGAYRELIAKNGDFIQLLKSWYIFYFQLPIIPELKLLQNNGESFLAAFQVLVNKGIYGRPALERYLNTFHTEGVLTSTVNYYRALIRDMVSGKDLASTPEERAVTGKRKEDTRVLVPTLCVFGEKDHYLQWQSGKLSIEKYTHPSVRAQSKFVLIPGGSHWIPNEFGGELSKEIESFLAQ